MRAAVGSLLTFLPLPLLSPRRHRRLLPLPARTRRVVDRDVADVVAHDDEVRAGAFDALVFRLGLSVGLLAASSSVSGEVEGEQGEQGESAREKEAAYVERAIVAKAEQTSRLAELHFPRRAK